MSPLQPAAGGTSRKSNSCGAWLQLGCCVLDGNVAVRKSKGKRFAPLEHLFNASVRLYEMKTDFILLQGGRLMILLGPGRNAVHINHQPAT